jgi:hypothetical protein
MVRLYPGESHSFDTEWFPTRSDGGIQAAKDSGVVFKALRAVESKDNGQIDMTGTFGVFFSGQLVAYFYRSSGPVMGTQPVVAVDPRKIVSLQSSVAFSGHPGRVSLHLVDANGFDRGSLGEVVIEGSGRTQ